MKNIKQNKNGFTLIEGLLVLAILAIIGIGGYFVASRGSNKGASNTTSSTKSSASTTWLNYCDGVAKLCFKYPSNWRISSAASPPSGSGNVQTVLNKSATMDIQFANYSASLGDPTSVFSSNPLSTSAPASNTTINLASSYPFYITAISNMASSNTPYKVVSGYYSSSTENSPSIIVIDASNVSSLSLKAGESNTLGLSSFNLTDPLVGSNIIFVGGGPISNKPYTPSEAIAWLSSADGKEVFQIVDSLSIEQTAISD